MVGLKLRAPDDPKPVKVTLELPSIIHRDLVAYAEILAHHIGQPIGDPVKLIGPMLAQFMATDRAFRKARRTRHLTKQVDG